MKTVNVAINRMTSNLIGTAVGAYAGYYVAKKLVKAQQNWMVIAISVVGAVVGANVQNNMMKKGAPTAATVTK